MVKIFDGRKLALVKEKQLTYDVAKFKKKYQRTPKLVSILIGDNPASKLYVSLKEKAARRVGILFEKKQFQTDTAAKEVVQFIREKNLDEAVSGVMIQMPLPKEFKIQNSKFKILGSIAPAKDVDCLTPENLGLLAMGKPVFLPATVKAVMTIIENCKLKIENSTVTVVGASNIVGKPLALHLSNLGATVTICRSRTKDLARFTQKADILISATGQPNLIKAKMVKKGAAVIDVGSPQGDVDPSAALRASFLTPVPGGVGPLTVICLLENVLQAALQSPFKPVKI